ncbi:hypothetical protein N8528_03415 [Akkermansiaceae bacterium]|nr:hypothetical protein [Akkermansiaceae bacterium]
MLDTLKLFTETGVEWTGTDVYQDDKISWLTYGRYPDGVLFFVLMWVYTNTCSNPLT